MTKSFMSFLNWIVVCFVLKSQKNGDAKQTMNIKFLFLLVFSLVIAVGNTTEIFGECDSELLRALRTEYRGSSATTIEESLYDISCSSSSSTKMFSSQASRPQYGEFAVTNARSSASQACAQRDYQYFLNNKTEIATSFLSKDALAVVSQCLGGVPALSATKLGKIVTVKAASFANNSDGKLSVVSNESGFSITSDSGKLECNEPFKPGELLIPGGRSITCTSNGNENIVIILNTDHGSQTVQIPRTPVIKYEPFRWEPKYLGGNPKRPDYQCKSGSKIIEEIRHVEIAWETVQSDVLRGVCLFNYGAGELTIDDGAPIPLKDQWGYTDYPRDSENTRRWIDCTVNGQQIGDKRIDVVQAHVSRSDEARIGYCANRYGLH